MIFDYAIEPEVMAEWSIDRQIAGSIIYQFCYGNPKILAKYPENWVEHIFRTICKLGTNISQSQRKTAELFLDSIRKNCFLLKKSFPFDDGKTWFANVNEYIPASTSTTIVSKEQTVHQNWLHTTCINDIEPNELWHRDGGIVFERTPENITHALEPILQNASFLIFVDPYLDFHSTEIKQSFQKIFEFLCSNRDKLPECIEWHCNFERGPRLVAFEEKCRQFRFRSKSGFKLDFYRWKENSKSGDEFHDRFLLCEYGGIVLGKGFAAGAPGQTSDANTMGKAQWQKRWEQFYYKKWDDNPVDMPTSMEK
ncbi:hypothetical protein ACFL5V_09370 [Fibrobacterota bacterium]